MSSRSRTSTNPAHEGDASTGSTESIFGPGLATTPGPALPDVHDAPLDQTAENPDSDSLTLARYAERAYLDYAISTVKSRALPDVCDGQKPVQRRILYAMNEMGLGPSAKPVKSARVVGDVLGKYHPHGDTAAYDALVRMAQSFSLRYPLIDGQGNFGSRDGDGAAAMRYTEARLTPHARLLLDEIDLGTVDFIPNYDGSGEEPAILPARLPMVLLNGASGIAVALATEIPSHNLREVAKAVVLMIRKPQSTLDDVLRLLPGPDFPGGAQIISSPADIAEAYRTGRGTLKLRARYRFEELARGQWQMVVDELPHGVSTQRVLEEVEELTNPKVRTGKKSLTPEQIQLRQQMLGVVDLVRDESGKEAAVRLVIEPKTSKIDRQTLANTLLAHTSLESSASINLVMIGRDGRPRQKNLVEILGEWVQFRMHTVKRRSEHRLGKVLDRIHILEGRQIVLLNIDEVIRIIRESDEPKPALIDAFGLSDRQAEDILEIRLRQLARLEAIRIEKELGELRAEQAGLEGLIGSEAELRKVLVKEVEADAKQYGDERRTLIEAAERATVDIKVIEEAVTVIVSERGWVRAHKGHGIDVSTLAFKSGDAFYGAFPVMTTDLLYALSSDGRVYSINVAALPSGRGDGVPVTSLVDVAPGARIEHMFACAGNVGVLLATANGYGFICQARDWQSRMRAGKSFLSIDAGDRPLRPALFTERDAVHVVCLTDGDKPRLLEFALGELKVLKSGGRGVTLMGLDKGEKLRQALICGLDGVTVRGRGRMDKPMERVISENELVGTYAGARARKGRILEPRWKDVTLERREAAPKAG